MNKKILFYFAVFACLTACTNQESVYDPSYLQEIAKTNFPVKDIDPNHDWNMTNTMSVSVSLNQSTKETYTVKIYTENPFDKESGAALMAKKENVSDGSSFTLSFDAPKAIKYVYVVLEDSKYNRLMKCAEVTNSSASVAWGGALSKAMYSMSSRSMPLSRSITLPNNITFPTAIPAGAKVYGSGNLNSSDNYYLDGSTNALTGVDINWNISGIKLYIKGNVTFAGHQFPDNYRVYILPGAVVKLNGGDILNSGANMYIAKGAKVIFNGDIAFVGDIYSEGTIDATGHNITVKGLAYNNGDVKANDFIVETGRLYNKGTMTVSSYMQKSGTTEAVNEGTMTISSNANQTNTGLFTNRGTYTALNLKLDSFSSFTNESGATVTINGELDLENTVPFNNNGHFLSKTLKTTSHAVINNKCSMKFTEPGSSLEQVNITLDGGCYLYIKSLTKLNNSSIKLGDKALLVIDSPLNFDGGRNTLEGPSSTERALFYVNGNMTGSDTETLKCTGNVDRTAHNDLTGRQLDGSDAASGSVDFSNVALGAESACSREFTTHAGGTPGKDDPQYYTFAFEDMFREAGDYDFNDVVVKVATVPVNGKIKVRLVAAGASKSLTVFYKLNNGKETALFGGKEVHEAFGVAAGSLINTGGSVTAEEVTEEIDVPSDFSINNLDVYIKGAETSITVHIPAFTDRFKKGDVPYAILVPDDWAYPSEKVCVTTKYPGFVEWSKDATKSIDWYK